MITSFMNNILFTLFRLSTSEDQLNQIKEENSRLRSSKGVVSDNNDNSDVKWRLQQLQTQYDYMVSKTTAQTEANKHADAKIEEYHQKVKELRRSLEELRHEKEISDAKAMRVESLEDTVSELRQANRSLEDKITRLCETPFISDAFGLHESKMRYEDMAKEREDLIAKVEHLQEAVRTHFSALTSLKQQASSLREDKEKSDEVAEDLKMKLQISNSGQNLLQDQLRLYSGDDGVDVADLEKALTMIKRATESVPRLDFLQDPDGEKLVTLPAIKRKLEDYQIMNLKITEENQRLESMLKLQTQISRDLHKEIEALVRTRDKDKQDLQQKAESFEEIAIKRLDKIHKLEAQVRQYIYGLSKNSKVPKSNRDVMIVSPEQKDRDDEDEHDNALLNELLEDKGGNIRDDENLMEIWIKGCTIRDGILTPGSSTFAVIDFFDYESQTTSLLSGSKPQWDFAATYKLVVDDYLLMFLATNVVTLELNMASQGDFTMLARCSVPMSALLKSKPRLKLINHPMISVKTGQIIANISLDVRLALPLSELYRLFLERRPNEKRHIEELSANRIMEAASNNELARNLDGGVVSLTTVKTKEDESRLYNELEIIIHRASGISMGQNNQIPTVFVHFQLLGHPDKLTHTKNSLNPEFNEKFNFPMTTVDQQLRLLQRSNLQLSLIDMQDEAIIGEVFVKLAPLADGSIITNTYNLKDANNKQTGVELHITLKWRHPLKKQRDLGPRALSGMEIELLISAFSPGEFEEGVIDYQSFCRFVEPPPQVLLAMDKLREFGNKSSELEGKSSKDLFKIYLAEGFDIDEETFIQRILKTQIDVIPTDIVKLFRFIDKNQQGSITLDNFLAVLNLDEISGIPLQLQNKLRERAKDLTSRGIPVLKLFQDADQWGANGLVTRIEFKNVLKKGMGFALIDEPDPIHSYIGGDFDENKSKSSKRSKDRITEESENDVLNDTIGSEDNILIQNELSINGGSKSSKGVTQGNNVQAIMKQQREIFEEKRAEVIQRSQKALVAFENNVSNSSQKDSNNVGGNEGINLLSNSNSSFAMNEHRATVANNNNQRSRDVDSATTDKLATKLQSHYRGYNVRKSQLKNPVDRSDINTKKITNEFAHNLSGVSNILAVETILNENIKSFGNNLPDIAVGFLKVDQKKVGLVSRMQFAHVLTQYPTLQLTGTDLKAAMDYFDVTGDGTNIDYNAFLRFYRYREPELIPPILRLQTMTLNKNSILRFRKYDQSGKGYIRRADMLKCLKELGQAEVSQSIMLHMLQLFETRLDGHINYCNFFEYIRESDLTQKLEKLSMKLFQLVTANVKSPEDPSVRDWFNQIDTANTGAFSIQQLAAFLNDLKIDSSKETISALYAQMDSDGQGVRYAEFLSWISAFNKTNIEFDAELSMYSSLSILELQRKAHKYVLAVASSTVNLEMLTDTFYIYDWRRSDAGAIAKPLFIKAVRRAGFPFTMNELRTLTSEFSLMNNGEVVSYKNFIKWVTPDAKMALTAGVTDEELLSKDYLDMNTFGNDRTPKRNTGIITRFLEKCMLRGIDLLSIFGRYDTITVGRVTSSEFCSALSDMGLSSVTQREALEFADRYKSAAGDFVMYRRIVTELLRQADEVSGAANIDPVEMMRASLQSSNVDVRRLRDVFEHYDRKGNGNVRKDDLETIMDDAKLRIKRSEIEAIANKFGMGDNAWMNYIPLLKALEYHITDRKGLKKLNFIPDEISSKVKAIIETLIIRGKDYRLEFDKFDDQYSGTILQSDFRVVMNERLGGNFSIKELDSLEKTYRSTNDPRKVNFSKLIHHLHPRNYGRVTFQVSDGSDVNPGEPWEVAELLRQKIRRRCDYLSPGELRGPFRHFSRQQTDNKSVSLEDFSIAVRNLGIRLASDQEKSVFDMINLSGSKTFNYNDFTVFVCDPQHIDIIWKLRRAIARARVSEKEIINALNEQDSNASGLITAKQFVRALQHCNIDISDTDAVRLMLRFDTEDSQRFDNDRFFRFLRGKQIDIDDNEYNEFDLAAVKRSTDSHVVRRSVDVTETHSWNSLKRRIEEKLEVGYTGNEVFAMFDPDETGYLDVASLQHGIQKLGLTLTNAEVRSMMRRMTLLTGGTVNRASFFEALGIDLRVFAVDNRDLTGGERGRRRRREYDELDEETLPISSSPRRSRSSDFDSILFQIIDKLEVSVHPKDRKDLPAVVKRALDKAGLQRSGFTTHRELKRYIIYILLIYTYILYLKYKI